MRLPKWVGSVLKIGTSWIPGLGTAVEEGLEHLEKHQDQRSMLASLLDLEEQKWRPDASPAALLRADFGVVPFHGRETEVQDLVRWCDSDRPLALRLYTAPGGFGKTRLLRHFVRSRRGEWNTGFLPEGKLTPEAIEALLGAGKKPLLLVLDYAESRTSEIEAIVRAAADTPRARVRIALLARAEGDWWSELKRSGDGVGDFFQGPAVEGPIPLPPLTNSLEARRGSYQNAVHAFAKVLGKETDAVLSTDPPLDHEDFERVLLVHAAALAAVEGEQVTSENLLDWLMTREERGLDRAREKQAGLGPEIQRATYHAAALVTLAQGADSRDHTVDVISRAPGLKDQPRARQEQIAEILHVLYQGRRWCDGVEPDLVGEHLVAWALGDAPELLNAAFGQEVPEAQLEASLTVLNRLAQRDPADRRFLEAAIGRGLRHLALPALRVAVAGGDPIGLVVADAFSRSGDIETARQVDGHLSYPTTSHREVAAQVEEMLLQDLRESAAEPDEIAWRSYQVSVRLADLGRREEALEAIRDAVQIYRGLGEAQPGMFKVYLLARSLEDLSSRLAAVGRYDEALEAIREAVQSYPALANEAPDTFTPDLARSRNNLSNRLADVGRHEDALEAIREAVDIHRELSETQPDAFKPDLAMSLNNLSERLADLGRKEEALDAIRRALEIYRALAEERSDAYRPQLAGAVNNLSNRLADVGQHGEALDVIREAVGIYRDLAGVRPDAFRPELAISLNNLANHFLRVDRKEEALQAIREAADIYRDLAGVRPDAFRPALSSSLSNLSAHLGGVGDHEAASEAIREAVAIARALVETRPDAFQPNLASSLNNLAIHLIGVGKHDAAFQALHESIEIRRSLARLRPDVFQPKLAVSLYVLQTVLRRTGQMESALQTLQEAIDVVEPDFIQLPQAHAGLMETLIADYEQTATACGVEPNRERLHRIGKILAELREEG